VKRRFAKEESTPPSALVPEVRAYIAEQLRCQRSIRVGEIAQQLGRSASYLNACFKAATGESISAYTQRQRIEQAKRLLESSDSLAEIWTELSYYDQPHFNRQFKKATGFTPQEYRKKCS
jgi:YesN/AraC family two-component response regulator